MIKSLADKRTAALFQGRAGKGIAPELAKAARAKLQRIERAQSLEDLRVPPGNRLEALRSARSGQWSIRVNDQWRICFAWRDGNAYQVELVDYH